MSDNERTYEGLVSLLAGIGVGAILGAMAALLLAPQSGAETRSNLGDTAHDVMGKMRDSMDDLRTKLDEVVAQTKQAVNRRGETDGSAPELASTGGPAADTPATSG